MLNAVQKNRDEGIDNPLRPEKLYSKIEAAVFWIKLITDLYSYTFISLTGISLASVENACNYYAHNS